ncbi:MAG: zinc ribbon domain-containing protein [Opitutae bacterium]
MPLYEFSCLDCSTDSEQLVRSSDWEGQAKCPECGSVKLEKKLSVFAASAGDSGSAEIPPCTGMPSSCGRCSLDN